MQLSSFLKIVVLSAGALAAALCLRSQDAPTPSKPKGLAPRATPGDYQAQGKAGNISIGAEFVGHAVPLPQETLSTEDFVVVEVGLFGPSGAKLALATGDFSLRINDRKAPYPNQPYELVFKSLKSPEYEPPSKSDAGKTSFGTGGGQTDPNAPPPPVHIPIEVRRTWQTHVQDAAMLEGERELPQAGLIYFQYRGKVQGIHSLELVYSGAAGKASVTLQP
jgi:hypothetical protein